MSFLRRRKGEPGRLPPDQTPIPRILKWGVEHPGITPALPHVTREAWRLTIDGEVDNPITLDWAALMALPQHESVSDFHCVETWSVLDQRWRGVRFRDLAAPAKPRGGAGYVYFTCSDGYTTSLPAEELQGDDVLLAHTLNGEPLPHPLGGPARIVVPHKYAYKSPMWVNRITYLAMDSLGFWELSGYSNTADPRLNDRYGAQ